MPPKRRTHQVRRAPPSTDAASALLTWTTARLRHELSKYGINADSWIKKSGLVALLWRAMSDNVDTGSTDVVSSPAIVVRNAPAWGSVIPSDGSE